MSDLLRVGDVFTCPAFAQCEYTGRDFANLRVDKGPPMVPVPYHASHEFSGGVKFDPSADDPSRGEAEFVVLEARLGGGGTAMFNDHYADGWCLLARRLNDDGSWNPEGELVKFSQTGCFSTTVKSVHHTRFMDLSHAGIVTDRLRDTSPSLLMSLEAILESFDRCPPEVDWQFWVEAHEAVAKAKGAEVVNVQ